MGSSELDKRYWEERYQQNQDSWDIGYISTPLKAYIDQLTDKNVRILLPGCGKAYEAQYLCEQGFSNVFVIDLAKKALDSLLNRMPGFPTQQLILGDFFTHDGQYDLILEQTFFSSIEPELREAYAKKVHELLTPHGKLSGVLFEFELDSGPPFGGDKSEYELLFKDLFNIRILEPCRNSIESRQEIELFMILEKI